MAALGRAEPVLPIRSGLPEVISSPIQEERRMLSCSIFGAISELYEPLDHWQRIP